MRVARPNRPGLGGTRNAENDVGAVIVGCRRDRDGNPFELFGLSRFSN